LDTSEDRIQRLLDQADIEGLLAAGAPADEYATEATMISRTMMRLRSDSATGLTIDGIANVIREVWQEMFGPFEPAALAVREPAFRKIAVRCIGE